MKKIVLSFLTTCLALFSPKSKNVVVTNNSDVGSTNMIVVIEDNNKVNDINVDTNIKTVNKDNTNEDVVKKDSADTNKVVNNTKQEIKNTNINSSKKISNIKISNNKIGMYVGEVYWLFVTNGSEDLTEKVKWSSSNPSVATVKTDGIVSADSVGTAIITATIDGNTVSCEVDVAEWIYSTGMVHHQKYLYDSTHKQD